MRKQLLILPTLIIWGAGCSPDSKVANTENQNIQFQEVNQVKIQDAFWKPKFDQWRQVTANDVFDKFESKHIHDDKEREAHDTFRNFDLVANGERDIKHHAGAPWFDGLIYETIRGVSDFISQCPDSRMEQRIDGYVDRIARAQASEADGYINTYTQLMESDHRWGENGGMLRWQHDVYNAGMLVEAGIHYYNATGKTKLLEVATRFANMMYDTMGPESKKNVVPTHSGPEEPLVKLYWLYKNNPELKAKINVPVKEDNYYELAKFWIENRGHHCGYPLWGTWSNPVAEQWIRDIKYNNPEYGTHLRPTWGDYAQDSIPVFQQQTIEGHAVRATLLATGIATAALENQSPEYINTVQRLWDNMVGRRMFVTGGVGAVHFDEKFGEDYFLPTDAYLETCAAVGAGFFSQRMNELTGDAKYMDELERVLYNNVLTGISLSGVCYTYQNPLNAEKHGRWEWHDCPCCPPMFLKITSAVPGFIYSHKGNDVYVNLFIGSETQLKVNGKTNVQLKQETNYPWDGAIVMQVNPEKEASFALNVRIPGWARGIENPYGLYSSDLKSNIELKVNGEPVTVNPVNGYAVIDRKWTKGDKVELSLPMQPRIITANKAVENLRGMAAIASGPIIYCLEGCDNSNLSDLKLEINTPMSVDYNPGLLNGVNVVKGKALNAKAQEIAISAIPYYAVGNRTEGNPYKVWIPVK
ncbi:MAG: glycoside hydrolase family 127 protein [Parabacteroides sp.]|nr:glycoside hydrolase family 127 protein [Parabacteroides sp.]